MECLGWYANRRSRDRIDATTKTSTWIIDKEEEGGVNGLYPIMQDSGLSSMTPNQESGKLAFGK